MGTAGEVIGAASKIAPMFLNRTDNPVQEESKFVQQPPNIPPVNGEYNLDAIDMEYVSSVIVPEDSYAR